MLRVKWKSWGEIQTTLHSSFFSLIYIQFIILWLGGVQGITLMFKMVFSFKRRKTGLWLPSWMSSAVEVGGYQFLNHVLQNEKCGIAFTLRNHMTSPTKFLTSLITITERSAQIFFFLYSIFLYHYFLSLLNKRHSHFFLLCYNCLEFSTSIETFTWPSS